ncbi:MAG: hypothetical protein WHV64_18225, partial [Geminicoccaceae bacterium]
MTASPTPRKRGPATPEGKARSALNALRHGLRARRFTLLPHEDPAEFEALAAATRQAYRPACPVERELVEALAVALWREIRADRLEAEILADIPPADDSRSCGSDLLDERHRASFSLLLRYRAQAAGAVRRAQEALVRHRKLVAGARPALLAEDRPNPEAEPVAAQRECTNEFRVAPAADRSAGEPAAPSETTNEIAKAVPPTPDRAPAAARDGRAALVTNDGSEAARPDHPTRMPAAPDPLPEAEAGPGRLALRDAVRAARNPLDQPLLRALGRDPELVLPVPGLPPEAWPWAQAKADPRGLPIAG